MNSIFLKSVIRKFQRPAVLCYVADQLVAGAVSQVGDDYLLDEAIRVAVQAPAHVGEVAPVVRQPGIGDQV